MLSLALAFLFSFQVSAQNDGVLNQLHLESKKGHQSLAYGTARQFLFGRLHLEQHGDTYFVQDVYCLKEFTKVDFPSKSGVGPNRTPDSNIMNAEHTWPQSRFTTRFPREVQKTDLHHLFPSDSKMNAIRGNFKFGEVSNPEKSLPCKTSELGRATGGYRFEPPTEHKGNVARALFYFSARYLISVDSDEEQFLRAWHREDPVDEQERIRNIGIAKLQGNRNPFIDRPELVDRVANF